jgi:hypothetical protein
LCSCAPEKPIDPLAAEHSGLAAVEAEQGKKPDCVVEVFDDKTDVDEVGDTSVGAKTLLIRSSSAEVPLGDSAAL